MDLLELKVGQVVTNHNNNKLSHCYIYIYIKK